MERKDLDKNISIVQHHILFQADGLQKRNLSLEGSGRPLRNCIGVAVDSVFTTGPTPFPVANDILQVASDRLGNLVDGRPDLFSAKDNGLPSVSYDFDIHTLATLGINAGFLANTHEHHLVYKHWKPCDVLEYDLYIRILSQTTRFPREASLSLATNTSSILVSLSFFCLPARRD